MSDVDPNTLVGWTERHIDQLKTIIKDKDSSEYIVFNTWTFLVKNIIYFIEKKENERTLTHNFSGGRLTWQEQREKLWIEKNKRKK